MTSPTQPSGGLEGYATFITGGGSGIGLGCAQRFARDGAHVTICGRTESRLAEAVPLITEAAAPGATVSYVVCDVTDEDSVTAAIAKAAEPTGSINGVVASAGGSAGFGPLSQIDLEGWRATMEMNVTGTMLTLKHWAALMVPQKTGSFVGVSSIAGQLTHRWFGAYGIAKAGIEALVELGADELGPANMRVNSIRPGLVDTDLVSFVTAGGEVLQSYQDNTPLARYGTVEDIAALARFLIGPESTWITGQNIAADGGQSLRAGPNYSSLLGDNLI